jgi:hypothetical protein
MWSTVNDVRSFKRELKTSEGNYISKITVAISQDNIIFPSPTETPVPTPNQTLEPTLNPSEEPTLEPTLNPSKEPTAEPTLNPSKEPTAEPTLNPSEEPTAEPTLNPSEDPTAEPTLNPSTEPTAEPTLNPSEEPTAEATLNPSEEPTAEPTLNPNEEPNDDNNGTDKTFLTALELKKYTAEDNSTYKSGYYAYVEINVKENDFKDKNIMFAIYDSNGNLIGLKRWIASLTNDTQSKWISYISDDDTIMSGASIKAFAWDTFEQIKPLALSTEYKTKD